MDLFSNEELTSRQAHKIWLASWVLETEQEFVDYLMTVTDQKAIEEFFNKCHDDSGRFCGGTTKVKNAYKRIRFGPKEGPFTEMDREAKKRGIIDKDDIVDENSLRQINRNLLRGERYLKRKGKTQH